jgi:RNA polymerase sigma-70 factor, ECF subfamily
VESAAESGRAIDEAEDGALAVRTGACDRDALAALFRRHHTRVFRAAYLVAGSREAADDIAQLVFLELVRALRTFDPARPFVPWLYRIVHHVGVDYLRRERYRRPTAPLSDATPGPADDVRRAELRADVRPALEGLSAEHREALVLRYYAGLSEREMAEALAVRPGTVKSRLHRALAALGAALGRGGDGPMDPASDHTEGSHG